MGEEWKRGSVAVLVEIREALRGLNWYIDGGTLLGAVRSGSLIPWRSCLNISVIDRGDNALFCLAAFGFSIELHAVNPLRFAVATRPGAYVDVNVNRSTENGVIYQARDYEALLPLRFFQPLGTVFLDGEEFPVPAHVEEYLTSLYGDWRTPKHAHDSGPCFREFKLSDRRLFDAAPRGAWHG